MKEKANKDKACVVVMNNMSYDDAVDLRADIAKAKNRIAPDARGKAFIVSNDKVGNVLQKQSRKYLKGD